jgi:hypothetical protein
LSHIEITLCLRFSSETMKSLILTSSGRQSPSVLQASAVHVDPGTQLHEQAPSVAVASAGPIVTAGTSLRNSASDSRPSVIYNERFSGLQVC